MNVRKIETMVFHGTDHPVYTISVAAELVGVNPRTLRIYDEEGLVCPKRANKKNRLYSQADLAKIQRIHDMLSRRQVNLATMKTLFKMAERFDMALDELIDEFFEKGGDAQDEDETEDDY